MLRHLRSLPTGSKQLLLVILVVGAGLRLASQVGRPFSGDEIATLASLKESYAYLLTNFGKLTMNYYVVLLKAVNALFRQNSWALVAPSLLAGIALIPFTAELALRFIASRHAALTAAFLVAVNPFLVSFSTRIRSYMLLVAFSLAALLCLCEWKQTRTYAAGVACAVWSTLALLVHPNAIYQMGFMGCLFLLFLRERRTSPKTLLIPMSVAVLLIAGAYVALLSGMGTFREKWSDTPPTGWEYLPEVARLYLGGAWLMWPAVALLGIGLWAAVRERVGLEVLALGIVVPMVMGSALGVSHYSWAFARFYLPTLPLLLIFVARGIAASTPAFRMAPLLLTLLVLAAWTPRLRASFVAKTQEPYAEVAAHLRSSGARAGTVLTMSSATKNSLSAYLDAEVFIKTKDLLEHMPRQGFFVVSEKIRLRTAAPSRRFGSLQVVRYDGDSRDSVARAFLGDLQASLRERINAKYADYYEIALDLLTAVGTKNDVLKCTVLYYECLLRGGRQRFVPPQLVDEMTVTRHAGRGAK